jgi:hypothetical protein
MAAPPEYYEQARDAVTHHVQMLIEEANFEPAGGYTRGRGPVLKVFRGPDSMVGTPMVLDLTTYRDSSEICPGSPEGYMVGRITAGKVLEAHLDQLRALNGVDSSRNFSSVPLITKHVAIGESARRLAKSCLDKS